MSQDMSAPSNTGSMNGSNIGLDASLMLEAALQQMDGIIAGKLLQHCGHNHFYLCLKYT